MDIVVRAFFAFLFVFLITRLIGRRELSSLEPFDLILLVVVGDLIQQGVTQSDMSFTGAVLATGTFAVMVLVVSYLGFRFRRLQPLLDPQPLIVVQDGEVIESNLRHERMTVDELLAEARMQQIASLDEVKWAVLESNGRVSFIRAGSS
jgi:uncharacterized membrane protein YcaP (DUF421 family)